VRAVILQKIEQHKTMQTQMKFAAQSMRNTTNHTTINMEINEVKGDGWTMYNGDCVRACSQNIKDESVGLSIFSPPFPGIFIYSKDEQDMGNNFSQQDFVNQFGFMIDELMRVTMPGRECVVHCEDIVATKWKDGTSGIRDFSGDISRAFLERGWAMTGRITIWKSPVLEMQRTKAHGLLYKTLRKDSAASRVGLPGYLMIFRKPGENPVPIEHDTLDIPLDKWQELASPVWMTVDHTRVLNGKEAREERDERHISPLQLDIIERALTLWSAPDDLVFSPFAGIGSEGYCALQMGRRFVGAELKESYFKQAIQHLASAKQQLSLL
jgi:hypothetical protein